MARNLTYVDKLPKCNFCGAEAYYDARTTSGPWAYMCEACFKTHGVGLGVGRGQRLEVKSAPLRECVIARVGQDAAKEDFVKAVTECAEKPLSVTMSTGQLEESVMEGLWYPTCPYCSAETPAEPDASSIYCQNCDKKFRIINPFF